MNFNNTWRNYIKVPAKSKQQLLLEGKRSELLLLVEGKKDEAKNKYKIAAQFGVIDLFATDLRVQFGDRGVGKYINFASREMESFYREHVIEDEKGKFSLRDTAPDGTGVYDRIMDLLGAFHTKSTRLTEKNINKYTMEELSQKLSELPQSPGERRIHFKDEKLARKNAELIYEENEIFAIRPLTTQSSCFYGQNPTLTNWCIATKSERNYFKQYTEQEGKAFVYAYFYGIPKRHPNYLITLEFDQDGDFTMIHDAKNKVQNPDSLDDIIEYQQEFLKQKMDKRALDSLPSPAEIRERILAAAKEAIQANPPLDPAQAAEKRCKEAKTISDAEYEFVQVSYAMVRANEHGAEPPVMFSADLEVAWDIDKPEYEDETGNVLLNKGRDFWKEFQRKFSDNLTKKGRPWSDMAGRVSCYIEDDYVKLSIAFLGTESYHPDNADGFESFCAEDCRAIENRGQQMQELLSLMLDAESGVNRSTREEEDYDDDEVYENSFYKGLESQLLGEEKGRSRQRGIYKFYCMIAYGLTAEGEKTRGLDDILADMRALQNVTIVTVAIRNQKVSEGKYIAGLAIKFIPSTPGDMNTPENVKAKIVRDIKRLTNVQTLFKLSTGLTRLE